MTNSDPSSREYLIRAQQKAEYNKDATRDILMSMALSLEGIANSLHAIQESLTYTED